MSIYTYRRSALASPDPWRACYHLLDEHPRYHDCDNCEHNLYCDYGLDFLISKGIEELLEENRQLQIELNGGVPPIDPNFRLTYAPKP
ncbi:MAG: hypothetical protein IJS96_10595 [Schwartzia sp.]|nr:hypothetical protein [Schwartzia sp. (in: firmicutes)]